MYFILIEADKGNTLGGSCIRDLWNTSNYIMNKYMNDNIYVFTNDKLKMGDIKKFLAGNFNVINNLSSQVAKIYKKMKSDKVNKLFVLISGHGYQCSNTNGDEDDGKNEYIRTNDGRVLDDDLCKMFLSIVEFKVVVVIDTCHSGTMMDPKDAMSKCITISSCKDSQLSACDIGNLTGFGGSLIIQLIDKDYLKYFIEFNVSKIEEIYEDLKKTLSVFGQVPVLYMHKMSWFY
jgi:hypothetical protein